MFGCRVNYDATLGDLALLDCSPMNTADLAEILRLARVDPTIYEILGSRHEALCILPEGQTWKVFLYERGVRHEERSFDDEDDACVWFLKRVLDFSRT